MEQRIVHDRLEYYFEQTAKFDTVTVEVVFAQVLDQDSVARRSLASQVMMQATANYPSKLATRAYLAHLLAAKVSASVNKSGAMHEVVVRFTFVDPSVANDPSYDMEAIFTCIQELLYQPYLIDGAFDPSIVDVEKRLMQRKIAQLYDDKTYYAQLQLVDHMFAQTPFAIRAYGTIADYEHIVAADVYASYQDMVNRDAVSIYVVGNVDVSIWEQSLDTIFKRPALVPVLAQEQLSLVRDFSGVVRMFEEQQEIHQTKLHLGYNVPTAITAPNYIAQRLAVDVLGTDAHSKLFQNVREKASLAYYAVAMLDPFSQALFIYAGIDDEKIQEAHQIIQQQIKDMQAGEVTQQELKLAKLGAIRRLVAAQDSQSGIISLQKTLAKLANIDTVEQWIAAIHRVSETDVMSAAQTWEENTIFLLRCMEEGGA